jgi:hypothetical protein
MKMVIKTQTYLLLFLLACNESCFGKGGNPAIHSPSGRLYLENRLSFRTLSKHSNNDGTVIALLRLVLLDEDNRVDYLNRLIKDDHTLEIPIGERPKIKWRVTSM